MAAAPDPRLDLGYADYAVDEPIDLRGSHAGDVLILLDSSWPNAVWPATRQFQSAGGRVVGVIYDLIPLSHGSVVDPGTRTAFEIWMKEHLKTSDSLVGISRATADAIVQYAGERQNAGDIAGRGSISWFHLGSELDFVDPSVAPRPHFLRAFPADRHVYLVVGSIEPRKGHAYVLSAFDKYIAAGGEGVLVVIGRQDWMCDDLLAALAAHPERDRRIFLFRDCFDEELDFAYRNASALIMASQQEGFGLPIVEAMQRGLPVMCSDIPVFREIADHCATFFNLADSGDLASKIHAFDRRHNPQNRAVRIPTPWLTWREAAEQLVGQALDPNGPTTMARLVSPATRRPL